MTINEAMRQISEEYDQECFQAQKDPGYYALMVELLGTEYREIDKELVGYVADIARGHDVPAGTILPSWVYQMARMCFRMGMRTQRKLDNPTETTTMFWRTDRTAV